MKRILSCLWIFLFINNSFISNVRSQWESVKIKDTYWTIASVYFVNQTTGFVFGGSPFNGLIYSTTDGGANWNLQMKNLAKPLISMYFIDNETGYAIGTGDILLKTVNSGISWETLDLNISGVYNSLFFTDANTGYAAGGNEQGNQGIVIQTVDGGKSWKTVYDKGHGYHTILFTGSTSGYIAGIMGTIMKTTNSAASWTALNSGVAYSLTCIKFIDSNTGCVTGGDRSGFVGAILRTTDGGNNWVLQYAPFALNSLYFVDGNTGYAVGLGGTIIKTKNGGVDWITQNSGSSSILLSVNFINSETGFVTGSEGVLLRTTTGGE